MTDDFFENPERFFQTHFPPGISQDHVIVLTDYDTNAERDLCDWAVHFNLVLEKVENNWGFGLLRGPFADFVVGNDIDAVFAKAFEMRRADAEQIHARLRAPAWPY